MCEERSGNYRSRGKEQIERGEREEGSVSLVPFFFYELIKMS